MRELKKISFILFISLFLGACGAHNKLSSPSRDYYKMAKDLYRDGHKLKAIEQATIGIKKDYAYENTKEFLYENFDKTITEVKAELNASVNTKDTGKADRRVYVYTKLVSIYSNLEQVTFPFKHHRGKWTWETDIKDYSSQKKTAILSTYDVFYALAKKRLYEKKVKEAYTIFNKANSRYYLSAEAQQKNIQKTFDEFFTFGTKYKKSAAWQEAVAAANAFYFATQIDKRSAKAKTEYEATSKRVSKLLVAEGKKLEQYAAIDSLVEAAKFYKAAVKWDENNQEAVTLKKEIRPKVAEAYYQKAKSLDKLTATDLPAIANYYKEAQKWVEPYKDCQSRIYSIEIRQEIKKLKPNVDKTTQEFDKYKKLVTEIEKAAANSKQSMDKITYVTKNMNDINQQATNITRAISPLTGLPVIGTALSVTKKSITTLQIPVDKTSSFFNAADGPVISPVRNSVDITSTYLGILKKSSYASSATLSNIKQTLNGLAQQVYKMQDEKKLKESQIAIKQLNKAVADFQNELKAFNANGNSSVSNLKKVSAVKPYTEPVIGGIKAVQKPIKTIGSGADRINGVLDKEIAMGYSARDALKLTGPLKWVLDKALGFLDPVLEDLSKSLPQIPGTQALMNQVNKFKDFKADLKRNADNIKEGYDKLSVSQYHINKNLNKLVNTTSHGRKAAAFEDTDEIFKIKSAYSTKYWDLSGSGTSSNKNGTNLKLWSLDNGGDRFYKFIPAGNGYYFIEFQNGGRVVDVSGGKKERGTNLQAWQKNKSKAQQFKLIPVPGKRNTYYIVNALAGKAIDAQGGGVNKNGINLHVWDFHGGKGQQWQLIKK